MKRYFPRDGQPKYPSLQKGLVVGVCPSLGQMGPTTLPNLAKRYVNYDVTFETTTLAASMKYDKGLPYLNFVGTAYHRAVITLPVALNDATISCWVLNRSTTSGARIVDNHYQNGFWIGVNGSLTSIGGGFKCSPSPYGSYGTIVAGVWNHVLITRAGTTNRTYTNGSCASSSNYTGSSGATTATTVRIGDATETGGTGADFQFDDLLIYNRVLAQREISTLAKRRGIAYESVPRRRDFSFMSSGGGGGGGTGGSVGLTQPLSFKLSEPLSVRL